MTELKLKRRIFLFNVLPTDNFVVYLMELYAYPSFAHIEALCKHFRLSNKQKDLAFFLKRFQRLLKSGGSDLKWVDFYADPNAKFALLLFSLRSNNRGNFMQMHKIRQDQLKTFIALKKKREAVVNATHLMQRGILPGKRMGYYLRKAWKVAVNSKITDPNAILDIIL